MPTIHEKLAYIQANLKAPKSQYNKFGGYNYRKAEDILEAVKGLLSAQGCTLTCSDELVLIGTRYYIKATATLSDTEKGESIATTAFAREEDEKKGMDGSQITGASSSYARKYALNGLFCIDDTADSDTTNVGDKPAPSAQPAEKPAPQTQQQKKVRGYSSLTEAQLARWVEAVARKEKTKDGEDAITYFLREYKPSAKELEKFNNEVFTYAVKNEVQL